jgi:hypothetical protein
MENKWEFVDRKKKQFNINYWVKCLLFKIENDNFTINKYLN